MNKRSKFFILSFLNIYSDRYSLFPKQKQIPQVNRQRSQKCTYRCSNVLYAMWITQDKQACLSHMHCMSVHLWWLEPTNHLWSSPVHTELSFLGSGHLSKQSKDKKEEIWPSPMTKAPTPTENAKRAKWQHKTTPQKSSIKQQLRTDLGWSVGVTTATQLVWLTWFTGPPSPLPQQLCNQKDTHLKICK